MTKIRWQQSFCFQMAGQSLEGTPEDPLEGKFHNTRSVGKPRTRWEDVVQSGALEVVGIRGWRRRGGDREEWRRLLREARPQKGL
jgi:hypothetical protein